MSEIKNKERWARFIGNDFYEDFKSIIEAKDAQIEKLKKAVEDVWFEITRTSHSSDEEVMRATGTTAEAYMDDCLNKASDICQQALKEFGDEKKVCEHSGAEIEK